MSAPVIIRDLKLPGSDGQVGINPKSDLQAILDTLSTLAATTGNIIQEIYRGAAINPYLAVISTFVTADILQKTGVIFPSSNLAMKGIALTVIGLEVTNTGLNFLSGLVADLTAISDIFGSRQPNQTYDSLLKPSASTIVYGNAGGVPAGVA